MSVLHICNTFFERELETASVRPLADWMRSQPIVLQLQFLPLLYADLQDSILVSDLPPNPDPRLSLLDSPPSGPIEHWGPSRAIAAWAKKHSIDYTISDWEIVQRINSKIFSFSESPKLPGAALLATESEAAAWIEHTPGPKVLKTAFGTAGTGHFHIRVKGKDPNLAAYLKRQFDQKLPVIGEPWVERLFDFSTQWLLGESIELLGATRFENAPNGQYLATIAGETSFGWELEEHLAIAKPLLKKIARLGFSGNLGIDAFVYHSEGKEKLHPIVEINGRKTMSWAALQIQRKKHPGGTLRFFFSKGSEGLLPKTLNVKGKTISFPYQLSCKALHSPSPK